jgi:hypothetical protein
MTDAHRKNWQDFKFTVDVIIAAALAREDIAAVRSRDAQATSTLRFNLLAAAASEDAVLPQGEWQDTRQLVSTAVREQDGELRITFQAQGFAALTRVTGRAARMVSANGEIEVAFRFDSGGRAIAVLADNADVRRALTDFMIVFD